MTRSEKRLKIFVWRRVLTLWPSWIHRVSPVWGRQRRRRGHWYGAAVADTASCITICSWRRCRRCSLTRRCQRIAQCNLHLPLLLTLQPDTHSSEVNHKFLNAMPKSTRRSRGHSLSLGTWYKEIIPNLMQWSQRNNLEKNNLWILLCWINTTLSADKWNYWKLYSAP